MPRNIAKNTEYRFTINELERRLIMRALTNLIENDRRYSESALTLAQDRVHHLIKLFSTIHPIVRHHK